MDSEEWVVASEMLATDSFSQPNRTWHLPSEFTLPSVLADHDLASGASPTGIACAHPAALGSIRNFNVRLSNSSLHSQAFVEFLSETNRSAADAEGEPSASEIEAIASLSLPLPICQRTKPWLRSPEDIGNTATIFDFGEFSPESGWPGNGALGEGRRFATRT